MSLLKDVIQEFMFGTLSKQYAPKDGRYSPINLNAQSTQLGEQYRRGAQATKKNGAKPA